ncbi:MAG: Ig-like domain-containing protein, partial [Methanobrevibacter sp.]|nr:Ig-like domain-containing protein [Candidatus Methanoflexus mossambicus]
NYSVDRACSYGLNIIFNGGVNYNDCFNIINVVFNKRSLNISAFVENDGVFANNLTVTLNLSESVDVVSNVTIGNQSFVDVRFLNGIAKVNYTVDCVGSFSLNITFNANVNYNDCFNIINVVFNKRSLNISAVVPIGIYGDNVSVTLKLNESVNVTSNVSLGNQNFINVNFVNGISKVNYTVDRVGSFSLIINFNGATNYNACSNFTNVVFNKRSLNISAIVPTGIYGDNVSVTLKLNDSVDVVSNVSLGNQTFVDVRFTNGIANISYLIDRAGEYYLIVSFNGSDNYNNCSNITDVIFNKRSLNISAIVPSGVYGDTVIVSLELNESVNVTSNVSLGNQTFVDVNFTDGIANISYIVDCAGIYSLIVSFSGDTNFNNCSNMSNVNFDRRSLNITAIFGSGVFGDDVTVVLYLNESVNVTSNVSLGNQTFVDVNFTNGIANVNYTVDCAGIYSLIIGFNGSDNYNNSSNVIAVSFSGILLNINATIPDGVYGNTVLITLNLNESVNMISTVIIGNQEFTNVNFKDGIAEVNYIVDCAGKYYLNISFNGGDKYSNSSNVTEVNFDKRSLNITAIFGSGVFGDNVSVVLELNESVNVVNNVSLGNQTFVDVNFVNGIAKVNYTVDCAGSYSLIVNFNGDSNYYNCSNVTEVNFDKRSLNITAFVPVGVFGDNVAVVLYLNVSVNVTSNVSLGNQTFVDVCFTDGIANINYTVDCAGEYFLIVGFNGDSNYYNCSNIVNVIFNKMSLNITAFVPVGVFGDNVAVILELNESVNVTSNVSLGNQTFVDVNFTDGIANINYTVDCAGEYFLSVGFSGDSNYYNSFDTSNVNFDRRSLNITAIFGSGVFGDNVAVVLYLNESVNVTGNVSLGNQTFVDVNFTNGIANINYIVDCAGSYSLIVGFDGDNNYYNCFNRSNVNFDRRSLNITAIFDGGVFGDNVIVVLELNESVDVVSNVSLGNQTFVDVNFTNGIANISYVIECVGSYSLIVSFNSSENYNNCSNITNVIFNKRSLNITAIFGSGVYGDNVIVSLYLNESVDVVSNVSLGNQNFINVNFINGIAKINYTVVRAGSYFLIVGFSGNSNYGNCSDGSNVNFDRRSLNITAIFVNDGVFGNKVIVGLKLNEAIDVVSNVSVGNQKFNNVRFVGGVANISYNIDNVGSVSLKVVFGGDSRYDSCFTDVVGSFSKRILSISAVSFGGVFGNNVLVGLKLNESVDIISNISIGNQNFVDVRFVGGVGNVSYNVDSVGSVSLKLVFEGNAKYDKCSNLLNVNFDKRLLSISTNDLNGIVGNNVIVSLRLNESINLIANITLGNQRFNNVKFSDGLAKVSYNILNAFTGYLTFSFKSNNYADYFNNIYVSFINQYPSVLTINPIANSVYGNTILINGTLKSINGIGINGTVNLIIGNNNYSIDSINGEWSLKYKLTTSGNYNVIVDYFGDNQYFNNTVSTNFIVNKRTTKLSIVSSVLNNGYMKFTATLKDNAGKYIKGQNIRFYLGGKYIGSGKTNSKGSAVLSYKSYKSGKLALKSYFGGNDNYMTSYKTINTNIYNKIIYISSKSSIKGKLFKAQASIYNRGTKTASFKLKAILPKNSYLYIAKSYRNIVKQNTKTRVVIVNVKNLKPGQKLKLSGNIQMKFTQSTKNTVNTQLIKLLTNGK